MGSWLLPIIDLGNSGMNWICLLMLRWTWHVLHVVSHTQSSEDTLASLLRAWLSAWASRKLSRRPEDTELWCPGHGGWSRLLPGVAGRAQEHQHQPPGPRFFRRQKVGLVRLGINVGYVCLIWDITRISHKQLIHPGTSRVYPISISTSSGIS